MIATLELQVIRKSTPTPNALCRQLILGSGQEGNVRLSPEAEAYFAKKDCQVVIQPTPQAVRAFNEARGKKIGLFDVTC